MPWSSYSACAVNDTATARDVQHSPLHYYHFFAIIFTRPYTRTGADPSSTHPSRRIDSATTTTHVSTPRKHVRCVSSGTCATHSVPWTRPGGASGNVFPGGGQANGRPGASQSHSCHRRCRGAVSTARSPPHPATTPSHTSQPCMPTRQAPRQATTPAAQLGGGRGGVYLHTAIVGATRDDAAADVNGQALDCLAVRMRNGCAHTHATKVEHPSVWSPAVILARRFLGIEHKMIHRQ